MLGSVPMVTVTVMVMMMCMLMGEGHGQGLRTSLDFGWKFMQLAHTNSCAGPDPFPNNILSIALFSSCVIHSFLYCNFFLFDMM